MRTIQFDVNQQRIKNIDKITFIYPGTDNYIQLKFKFSEDWNGCAKGIAFGKREELVALLLDKNDCCTVPKEAFDEKELVFYLVGKKKPNYRIQTQKFVIKLS